MLPESVADLLRARDGVGSRRELLAVGLADHDLRRLVRQRRLVGVHPGVYVDHTGPLTWLQRAWAAVLAVDGALRGESALRAADGPGRRGHDDAAPIQVAVDRARHVAAPDGVVVRHVAGLADRALWNANPPRIRVEDALLDVASRSGTDLRAIALLADAVQARLTTADRLAAALSARRRIGRRAFLAGALADIADGTCSVLEWEYLRRVERAHHLPRPRRQAPGATERPTLRDLDYPEFGLAIELDGRLFHDSSAARALDLERDLDSAVAERRRTVRLGWGQVVDRPCATARKVGALLAAGGWSGQVTPCPDCR